MQDIINKQREDSELAIFWQEIEKNLPKSQEMSALGTKPVFLSFKIAYPNIKKHLISQLLQVLIEREEKDIKAEVLDQNKITPDWQSGYYTAKTDTINNLKTLQDSLQTND